MLPTKETKRTILVISNNIELKSLISRKHPNYDIKYGFDSDLSFSPDFIISECRLQCNAVECLKKSLIVLSYPRASFVIARPILPHDNGSSIFGYWLSYMNSSTFIDNSFHLLKAEISKTHPFFNILNIQQKIVENKGKKTLLKMFLSETNKSYSSVSNKFKLLTNVNISDYQRKIFMCHTLCDLNISDLSIKEIAYRYGYHPFAFSKIFSKYYDISPKNIWNIRNKYLCQ